MGDLSFVVLGAPEEGDELIERGSLDTQSYALFYLKNNVLRTLFSMGRRAVETRIAEGLIRYRVNLIAVKERLRDPAFALEEIPAQTALILQGGGALGAFECGVVKALEEEQIFPDIVAGASRSEPSTVRSLLETRAMQHKPSRRSGVSWLSSLRRYRCRRLLCGAKKLR